MRFDKRGKRFSTELRVSAEHPREIFDFLREHGRANDDGRVAGGGWRRAVRAYERFAVAHLKSAGLPYSPELWKVKTSPGWTDIKPAPDEFAGFRSLDEHIMRLGYGRDSSEDLAARIITSAHRLHTLLKENATDAVIEQVLKLERAAILFKVYGIESAGNRRNASAQRKMAWAVELAEELAAKHQKFSDAWVSIDEDGLKIYRSQNDEGKEFLHCSDSGSGDQRIERESFRTGYFVPAMKKHKIKL